MVCHHPVKIGGHRHCCSGDIMFLVAEEEDSRCSRFNPSLKGTGRNHTAYHIDSSDPGHTRLEQQLHKNFKITFASPSRNTVEKNEKKKIMAIAKLFALHANAKTRLITFKTNFN